MVEKMGLAFQHRQIVQRVENLLALLEAAVVPGDLPPLAAHPYFLGVSERRDLSAAVGHRHAVPHIAVAEPALLVGLDPLLTGRVVTPGRQRDQQRLLQREVLPHQPRTIPDLVAHVALAAALQIPVQIRHPRKGRNRHQPARCRPHRGFHRAVLVRRAAHRVLRTEPVMRTERRESTCLLAATAPQHLGHRRLLVVHLNGRDPLKVLKAALQTVQQAFDVHRTVPTHEQRAAEPKAHDEQVDRPQHSGQVDLHLSPVGFAQPAGLLHPVQTHLAGQQTQLPATLLDVAPNLRDASPVAQVLTQVVGDRQTVVLLLAPLQAARPALKHLVDPDAVFRQKYAGATTTHFVVPEALHAFLKNL